MAGSFYLFLLLSLFWKKRWLTVATVGLAIALGVFLGVFNIKGGPLEGLRQSPAIGRFGLLLDAESNSALVRKYIWEGAADLVAPHDPLTFPDGSKDRFNFLRPIIGYGPESMYVAYNPFYVPELAQVERRNASPDRSHNETWDSLVITGFLGIVVYLSLFTLVFYYALKWIGLVLNNRYRNIFLGLVLGIGILGGFGLIAWRGIEYFGVGLPFGMLLGLLLYITLVAIFGRYKPPETIGEAARSLTLIILLAGIVSHFVEINFGIAIAATRTYFWVYAALILVVGRILPEHGEYVESSIENKQPIERVHKKVSSSRKRRRGGRESDSSSGSTSIWGSRELLISAMLVSLIMVTLGYNFITNPRGIQSTIDVIWTALTRLPNRDNALSFGVFGMILTTWIVLVVTIVCEAVRQNRQLSFSRGLIYVGIVTSVLTILFWLWHASSLATMASSVANDLQGVMAQVGRYKALLTNYYIYGFVLLIGLAYFLSESTLTRTKSSSVAGIIILPLTTLAVIVIAIFTNLRVIQADIVYKLADPFQRSGQWLVAINIYDHANDLAPNEDYYYLFLGRAYLEQAKTMSDPTERDRLIDQAARDLRIAQEINPLNTDHTANLGRLYSLWASFESEPAEKENKAKISEDYFSKAVTLSPKNARLWDEWAILYMNILQDPQKSLEKLNTAKEIDPEYHWTYALLGEYYSRLARDTEDASARVEFYNQASSNYAMALELPTPGEPLAKYNYALALGSVESQAGNLDSAIQAYETALESKPNNSADEWRIEEALARLFAQNRDFTNAMIHAQQAKSLAPQDQTDRLDELLLQIQASESQQ
jgi:Flp pilus assembly protein TadD